MGLIEGPKRNNHSAAKTANRYRHYRPSRGGSVILDPLGVDYENGTEVTVTVAPFEGYVFESWIGDVSSDSKNENQSQ